MDFYLSLKNKVLEFKTFINNKNDQNNLISTNSTEDLDLFDECFSKITFSNNKFLFFY